jgi:extracellular factor (EF) 3-hydroxypalmitic acid methyl ester biosynthesis protein
MFFMMNHLVNGNGSGNGGSHGNGTGQPATRPKPELTDAQHSAPPSDLWEPQVSFQAAGQVALRGTPLRILRHSVVFELYNPMVMPQVSEVFNDFKIKLPQGAGYAGRAVMRSVVNTDIKTICEATLEEQSWPVLAAGENGINAGLVQAEFRGLIQNWQKFYRVSPAYKEVIADLHSFMTDLRSWLDRVELRIRALPAADRAKVEMDTAQGLRDSVLGSMNGLFDRFEVASNEIEEEFLPAHRAFGQRLLHPFMLSSPFLRRTYTKPLGYAGDYEMMNMIVRNQLEGDSLFGKFANAYLLAQAAPQAVRNRVDFLRGKIIEETGRLARQGQRAKISSIACGPAWEAVTFLADHPLASHAQFQLLDFDAETLQHTTDKVAEAKRKSGCRATVNLVKNSVQSLLRSNNRAVPEDAKFDLIYCSGLYDYLSDQVCRALNNYFYNLLRPGGLLVVGNFAPNTPHQNIMEHFAEWFLIYRDAGQLTELAPDQAARENCFVRAEPTGANIFLEIRKP